MPRAAIFGMMGGRRGIKGVLEIGKVSSDNVKGVEICATDRPIGLRQKKTITHK